MGNCAICGKESVLACSDCGIEQQGCVYVCAEHTCQDTHESVVHGQKWTKLDVHAWSWSTGPKNLICPVCGHTDREPQQAGNPCPKCEALPGMGVLESIDPDVLKALEPFVPEEQRAEDSGNIWLYNKKVVALPETSTFQVMLNFGNGEKIEPSPDQHFRVKLFGQYTNTVPLK